MSIPVLQLHSLLLLWAVVLAKAPDLVVLSICRAECAPYCHQSLTLLLALEGALVPEYNNFFLVCAQQPTEIEMVEKRKSIYSF